ncbi:DUF6286 domain-containing protein [Streptomyces sp. TP-A0874]|uniref:DUF6286 domain-containing protein n=1 Tax=Streptomyces sp. TP-A0874 TaxID=549819 RepID=UPI0009A00AE7|nr:DUF6286 domain-containing protein [Streptomyces sp. TP-A0874]
MSHADAQPPAPPSAGGGRSVRRFWSTRRVPATVVALLCTAGIGLALYDLASVRLKQPEMTWRRRLSQELATRPIDDVWVITGAAVAMAVGLWLIVLALTPGMRSLLSMRPPEGGEEVRAGIDRSAAGLVLRDRAMEVGGVQNVRVDVGRRRVRAEARAHFRELDAVREDLTAALDDGVRELGLRRRPRLSVHVRRPRKR